MKSRPEILSGIGSTPLVELRRVVPGATVGTLACDSGLKYLSTDLYTSG